MMATVEIVFNAVRRRNKEFITQQGYAQNGLCMATGVRILYDGDEV
jgi:hypothetical protein